MWDGFECAFVGRGSQPAPNGRWTDRHTTKSERKAGMIGFEEYASLDGIGLAQLIGRGEVSAQEVVDTAIAAIEKMNPHVNAVLQFLPDAATATAQADLPSGPFRGVPSLIKEIVLSAKGVRCESGTALAEGYVPKADTDL